MKRLLILSTQTASSPFLLCIFVVLIQFPPFLCNNNSELYKSCRNSFNCGGIRDVDYPFWGANRPRECGHPGLELGCNGATTTIEIMNVKYRVRKINQNNQILTLTRADISPGDICPDAFKNTTIDSTLFEYASGYVNLTIQYGCPPLNVPVPQHLSCTINGITYQNNYIVPGAQGPGACRASIFIPIHSSSFEGIGEQLSNLGQLIEGGFEVRWKVDSSACNECKNSGGRCGYDLKSNQFTCLCPDQPSESNICRNTLVDSDQSPQPSTPSSGMQSF